MTMISNVIMLNKLTDDIIVTIFAVLTTANKHVSTLHTTFLTLQTTLLDFTRASFSTSRGSLVSFNSFPINFLLSFQNSIL
jgi:hypothetical protein